VSFQENLLMLGTWQQIVLPDGRPTLEARDSAVNSGIVVFAGAKDISGPLQYQVLKRTKERCELCGISGKVKALQVHHIKPRSKGGLAVLENLQALCYRCNAPRSRIKTMTLTLKSGERMYMMQGKRLCVFCNLREEARLEIKNSLAMAFEDKYPVTEGHMLVSPLLHMSSFF
jgi:ATP adenylyltransferase